MTAQRIALKGCVVRVQQDVDNVVTVKINPIKDGQEHYPLGYLTGSNYLQFQPKFDS